MMQHLCVVAAGAVLCRVNALAGSGKSSVLRLLQLAHPDKTIL